MNETAPQADVAAPLLVVGTDFSVPAAGALREARRLARELAARVEVVHVSDGFHVRSWDPLPANERWLLDAHLPAGELTVRYGVPWVELVRHVEACGAALLVVGSHGASGPHTVGLGGTAVRVSTQARCPVVLVNGRTGIGRMNGMAERDGAAALARQTRESNMETGQ